jgi:hypothetical protein
VQEVTQSAFCELLHYILALREAGPASEQVCTCVTTNATTIVLLLSGTQAHAVLLQQRCALHVLISEAPAVSCFIMQGEVQCIQERMAQQANGIDFMLAAIDK